MPVAGKYKWMRRPHLLPSTARRYHHVEKIQIHAFPIDARQAFEGTPVGTEKQINNHPTLINPKITHKNYP